MTEPVTTPPAMTAEEMRAAAQSAGETAKDLEQAVRDLTLRALRQRALEPAEIKAVLAALSEGLSIGLAHRAGEIGDAAHAVLRGLDAALAKAAEATKLAAEELVARGKDIVVQDLGPVLEDLRHLEKDLLETLSDAARRAGGRVRISLEDAVAHARRAGTDTGRAVAETLADFNARMGRSVASTAVRGAEAARELGRRLEQVASGILAALAEEFSRRAGGKKDA